MNVEVIFFGELAELAVSKLVVADVGSLRDLEAALFRQYPQLKGKRYAVAVNKKIHTEDVMLSDGSTIAFMPPFSGG